MSERIDVDHLLSRLRLVDPSRLPQAALIKLCEDAADLIELRDRQLAFVRDQNSRIIKVAEAIRAENQALAQQPTDLPARAAWHKQQWAECCRLIGSAP